MSPTSSLSSSSPTPLSWHRQHPRSRRCRRHCRCHRHQPCRLKLHAHGSAHATAVLHLAVCMPQASPSLGRVWRAGKPYKLSAHTCEAHRDLAQALLSQLPPGRSREEAAAVWEKIKHHRRGAASARGSDDAVAASRVDAVDRCIRCSKPRHTVFRRVGTGCGWLLMWRARRRSSTRSWLTWLCERGGHKGRRPGGQ